MFRLIGAIAAVCLFSAVARADSVRVAGWEIKTLTDSGEKTGCMMGADYRGGTRVNIVMMRSYTWGLALHNPSWGLREGRKLRVHAYVDRRLIASGHADVIASNAALLPLKGAEAYRALQLGHGLQLVTEIGQVNLALTGTAKAMGAVLECVQMLNGQIAESQETSDYHEVSGAEATVLLTNILNAANVSGYTLLPPQPDKNAIHFKMENGSGGAFFAHRGKGTPSADTAANTLIASETSACKGDYLSGKQSIPSIDGSVIRKVVATCKTGDAVLVTETIIIRRENGFLLTLMQFAPESLNGSGQADDASESTGSRSKLGGAIVDAALKFESNN